MTQDLTASGDTTLPMVYSQVVGSSHSIYHFRRNGIGFTATNPDHNLTIDVNRRALTISINAGVWHLEAFKNVDASTLAGNRLTIHRSGFDEWYVNGPLGLQQGFTLYEPSDITFDVGGTLPTAARDQSLMIGDTLTFSGLMAYDATGQAVPVAFALNDNKLTYVYNDRNATYPLTIDPWFQQQKLTANDAAEFDLLGESVSLSGDTAVIGSRLDDCTAGSDCGSAYVFTRNGGLWKQQAKLTAYDAAADDNFGRSVALSGDTALIGAHGDDCSVGFMCGSAYVFTRTGNTWSLQAKLTANDPATSQFGTKAALDGDTAVIGASNDGCGAGPSCGSAYVFIRSGSFWFQQAKLIASDPEASALFGEAVAIDGDTVLIGARWDDCTAGFSCGSAYVFIRSGSFWFQQAKLTAADKAEGDGFGWSVALSGNTALIGTPGDDCTAGGNFCGSAHMFTRSGGLWTQQAKVTASDAAVDDQFGQGVALDGDSALIGAPGDDCGAGWRCGSTYVFTRSGSTWTQRQKIVPSGLAADDQFAGAVALDGGTAIIGAYGDDCPAGVYCGSAYIFNTAPLTVSIACSGPNLQVTISNGDGLFNITASAGVNTPKLNAGIGTTTVNGPEKWDDLTVTELGGNAQSINYGQFRCRSTERPAPLMPAHGSHTTNTSPLFSWTAISDANNYRLFVYDDANPAARTVDIRQNSGGPTSMTLSTPLPTMRLFWRVRGRQNRLWSLWSVRFTLFVDPVVAAPAVADTAPVPSGADGSSPPNNRDSATPPPTQLPQPPPTPLPPPPNSR